LNRSDQHRISNITDGLPTLHNGLTNYSQQAALGYTHIFDPNTLLNFRFGYTYTNDLNSDEPAGPAFNNATNFTQAVPPHAGISLGPFVELSNGYTGVSQFAIPLGPQEGSDYHLDLSKVVSNHTLGVGGMYYHIMSYDDGWLSQVGFTQNGTSQNGQSGGATGFGPASFMLGVPDSYSPWVGEIGAFQTVNWFGLYAQDQWRATKRLTLTYGLRWDYVSPPNFHKIVSGVDALTGQFLVTGPVAPYFSKANASSGYFNPQYNGFEPRFGLAYQAKQRTVLHAAFVILDDHNNTVVQENQGLRLSWPTGIAANFPNLDLGQPTYYLNSLPSAASILNGVPPYASFGANPNNRIPYSMQFNAGIQQQLSESMVFKLDYVGALDRHQYIVPIANTALTPGPGPISARAPFSQYSPFDFEWNDAPAKYNALQAVLQKTLSSGLFFRAAYTWSRSLDWQSDPYGAAPVNIYNLPAEYGPSDYNRSHMFVFSAIYALPIGSSKRFLPDLKGFGQAVLGGWNAGTIVTLNSGAPFDAITGSDISNTGDPTTQRGEMTGANPYSVPGGQSAKQWLNPAAFALPAPFTYGNEGRNNLVGPAFRNVDFNASKDIALWETAKLQFRTEFFNFFNHTNYGNPVNNLSSGAFGQILATANGGLATGREIQFGLKIVF
jgi:hypothetical protein